MAFGRRKKDLDVHAAVQRADEVKERLDAQQPKVDRLSDWLINRKNQNGFGRDFEWTLRPKGTSR